MIVKGYRVTLQGDKNILKLTVEMVVHICKYTPKPLDCTLEMYGM